MSVASVQQHLQASGKGEEIAVGPYLAKLCESWSFDGGDNRPISLKVEAGDAVATSEGGGEPRADRDRADDQRLEACIS